jgi:hypothetical protein
LVQSPDAGGEVLFVGNGSRVRPHGGGWRNVRQPM